MYVPSSDIKIPPLVPFSGFVIGRSNGTVLISKDGITWTSITVSSGSWIRDVTYGGGILAVSFNTDLFGCSTDCGSTFTTYYRGSSYGKNWTGIAYGFPSGGSYSGTGVFSQLADAQSSNSIAFTTNPANSASWTLYSRSGTSNNYGMAYGGGAFINVGNYIWYSNTGYSYTGYSISTGDVFRSVTWDEIGSRFLTLGYSTSRIHWFIPNGATFTTDYWGGLNYTTTWTGVACGNGRVVCVGETNVIDTCPISDLTDWYGLSTGVAGTTHAGIAYGMGLFVTIPTNASMSTYYTSPDGITWTARALPTAASSVYNNCIKWCGPVP